jgi:hypothetical protein
MLIAKYEPTNLQKISRTINDGGLVALCQEVGGVFNGLFGVSASLRHCPPSRPKHLALRLSIRNHRFLIARRCTRPFTAHFPFGMPSHLVPLLESSLIFFGLGIIFQIFFVCDGFCGAPTFESILGLCIGRGRARAIELHLHGFESSTIQYGRWCKTKSHGCILSLIDILASWISSANYVSKQPHSPRLVSCMTLCCSMGQYPRFHYTSLSKILVA